MVVVVVVVGCLRLKRTSKIGRKMKAMTLVVMLEMESWRSGPGDGEAESPLLDMGEDEEQDGMRKLKY
jgi:hypothetical protein